MKLKKTLALLSTMLLCICMLSSIAFAKNLDDTVKQLEREHAAEISFYALDLENGKEAMYYPDRQITYCSTFKVLLVAETMKQGHDLNKTITYSANNLVMYSPITEKSLTGGMTIDKLCEAALRVSDNTAANLLLNELGGPAELKKALNKTGDHITLPEKNEPMLNVVKEGEMHDTSTPRQMVLDYQKYLLTDKHLSKEQREKILDYMEGNETTKNLICAGIPESAVVADKSGSGPYGIRNDVAIVFEEGRKPLLIGIFTRHKDYAAKADNALVAEIAHEIYTSLR